MLAIKTVLADKDQIETVIFDEIDVGISGRTAQKVSEKMMLIGRTRQVICITHLAQIAAMADTHFRIEKQVRRRQPGQRSGNLREAESIDEAGPYPGRCGDYRRRFKKCFGDERTGR